MVPGSFRVIGANLTLRWEQSWKCLAYLIDCRCTNP